jgi:hypothetical protein
MATALLELYELFEKKLGKEEAKEAIELVGKAIEAIREEAKDQKPILKAEIREELRKELVTKEEFFGEVGRLDQKIETVRQEIQTVRQEIETVYRELDQKIETVRQELKGEIKVLRILIYVTLTAVILMNKGTIEYLISLIKMVR